jgi:hypothetical protein
MSVVSNTTPLNYLGFGLVALGSLRPARDEMFIALVVTALSRSVRSAKSMSGNVSLLKELD